MAPKVIVNKQVTEASAASLKTTTKRAASKSKTPEKKLLVTKKSIPTKQVEESKVARSRSKGKVEETKKQAVAEKKNVAKTQEQDKGPLPKRAAQPYTLFNTEFVKEARLANPDLKTTEAFKQAGAKWSTMSDQEKEKFVKLAEADKTRHDNQMAEREKKGYFLLSDKSKSTDPKNASLFKAKKSKDDSDDEESKVNKPKRPAPAYTFFNAEFVTKARKSNPELKTTEAFKLAGQKWATMSEKEKEKFQAMAAKEKKRYDDQVQELQEKGYFVMDDGSKSTDEQNAPKSKVRRTASKSPHSEDEVQKVAKKPMKKAAQK